MDVKQIAAETAAPSKPVDSDKGKRAYSFRVVHGSNDGVFTTHILTNNKHIERGTIAARCRGGMPYESFSTADQFFTDALAHITVSIPDDDRPEWAKDFGKLDRALVLKLYEEVRSHEDCFLRRREAEETSASAG